jgi:hypothetical protein
MEKKTGEKHILAQPLWAYSRQFTFITLISLCLILFTGQVSGPEQISGPYLGQEPPGSEVIRFARGLIPDDLHAVPVFSNDGSCLYYKSMEGNDIMICRQEGRYWTPPSPLFTHGEMPNSDDPCLSPEGDMLFFSSYSKEDNRDYIYYCHRTANGHSVPGLPEGKLNDLDLHWQFSMAENGNIYYASRGNIYCAERLGGVYGEPYKLGASVNTPYSECTPYISPSEDLIIFARSVTDKPDLYFCKREANGEWTEALPLNTSVNTPQHEMCPRMTNDGKYFFFLSSREGLFSAYWVNSEALGI